MADNAQNDEELEEGAKAGWIVSFADLMTLLFCAFVVLYGISPQGERVKVDGLKNSIREAFAEISDEIEQDQEVDAVKKGKFLFKAYYGDNLHRESPTRYNIKSDPKAIIDRDKNLVKNLLDQISMSKNSIDYNLRMAMNAEKNERGFTIKLMGSYFFKPNSYHFERKARERFIRLGKLLKKINKPLLIEGHTDNKEGVGLFSDTDIGALRAGNAIHLLTKNVGINPLTTSSISYGAKRPIASNQSKNDRKKNRRIEIKVLYY